MKQDWNSRFRKYNFYDICLSKNYLLVCVLLTTAKKLSPSLCNWRNLVVCWGVNQLHYAFFCLSWALFFFLLPLFTFVGHAKKEGNLQHFETSGKSGCRFFCQSFSSCTNYETPPPREWRNHKKGKQNNDNCWATHLHFCKNCWHGNAL